MEDRPIDAESSVEQQPGTVQTTPEAAAPSANGTTGNLAEGTQQEATKPVAPAGSEPDAPATQNQPELAPSTTQQGEEESLAASGEDADQSEAAAPEQQGPAAEQDLTMEQLLAGGGAEYKSLRRNEVVDGTVMGFDRDGLLVDVGSKSEGVVPAGEMSTVTPEERESFQPGAPVLVSVVDANDNNEGQIVLSIDRARAERSWRNLAKQLETGEVIEAPVVGHNKGGLLVDLSGVRGFVPASQVTSLTGGGEEQRQAELAAYGGRQIAMKVIEVNRRRNRLILSERQATQERRESRKERLLEELREGQVIRGTVTSLADFGAFVDIGGADGLIHLSELSWSRVNHPRDVLKPGDKVDVMVLNVDREHRKIALSAKRTQPEPWSTALDRYELGQIVTGTVTQVAPFGAFVRLEDGIEGLVHVSELTDAGTQVPGSVVKEGDVLRLKVIRIDTQRKRIGLSLRQATDSFDEYPPDSASDGGGSSVGEQASALSDGAEDYDENLSVR